MKLANVLGVQLGTVNCNPWSMPYEEHPVFHTPSGDQEIWRYITLPRLMWICQSSQLHFHRTGAFEDPYEGIVPRALIDMRKEGIRQLEADIELEELQRDWEEQLIMESIQARAIVFANSWYANDVESAAMWDIYQQRGRPISIKSTISNLTEAVEPIVESVHIGEIFYVDHDSTFEDLSPEDQRQLNNLYSRTEHGNMLYPILTKRKEFSHENEIRAIYPEPSAFDVLDESEAVPMVQMEQAAEEYYNLSIDVNALIDAIYIGPETPVWMANTIRTYIDNSSLSLDPENDVRNSDLDRQPFR